MQTKLPASFNKNYNEVIKRLDLSGIVPIVKISNESDALPIIGIFNGVGIDTVVIPFRTSAAKDVLRIVCSKCTNMLVGAGTVISIDQVNEAVSAGAKFIVSPGFNAKVVDRCIELGVPVFPGCSNPSEIGMAYEKGLRVVNFFPAELSGGVNMLKALSGPFPLMKFIPTGGINSDNLDGYLSYGQVLCCGGSYLAKEEMIKTRQYAEMANSARESINKMLDIKLDHVAINTDPVTGTELLKTFSKLAGGVYERDKHTVGGIEVVCDDKHDTLGHVAFSAPNLERCIYYLEKRGFSVDRRTIVKDGGKIVKLHLSGNNAGFTIQLIRK